jgi:hypothetical protein
MNQFKQPSLRERAALFSKLIQDPAWELLQRAFRPEIRSRVTDTDAREAFLYEAIRAQVIQEIFSTPHWIISQAEREWSRGPVPPETDDEFIKET